MGLIDNQSRGSVLTCKITNQGLIMKGKYKNLKGKTPNPFELATVLETWRYLDGWMEKGGWSTSRLNFTFLISLFWNVHLWGRKSGGGVIADDPEERPSALLRHTPGEFTTLLLLQPFFFFYKTFIEDFFFKNRVMGK